jgi:hypothetical protein
MVLANLVFNFFAMGISFYDYVIQGGTGDSVARWMIVHGVLGVVARATALACSSTSTASPAPIRTRRWRSWPRM